MRGDDKEAWVISAGPTTAERVRRLRFDRFALPVLRFVVALRTGVLAR